MVDSLKQYCVQLDEASSTTHRSGSGAFGVVYKARLHGARCVVKRLHDILLGLGGCEGVSDDQWKGMVAKFRKEIELLSRQRHPNIVQFLGVCGIDGDPRNLSLVMEELDTDLEGFIRKYNCSISLSIKLSILRDVSCGVGHLHANNIIHRDLNAGNVLLSTSLQAKVADLGVSRIIDPHHQYQTRLSKAPGALDYMPPEVLRDNPTYGVKMDSFSYGHLALYLAIEVYPRPQELLSHEMNLRTDSNGQLLVGLQIQKRQKWIQQLKNSHPLDRLIKDCLKEDSKYRPSMKELREQLEKIMTATEREDEQDVLRVMELRKAMSQTKAQVERLERGTNDLVQVNQKQYERLADQECQLSENRKVIRLLEAEVNEVREKITSYYQKINKITSDDERPNHDLNGQRLSVIKPDFPRDSFPFQDMELNGSLIESCDKQLTEMMDKFVSDMKVIVPSTVTYPSLPSARDLCGFYEHCLTIHRESLLNPSVMNRFEELMKKSINEYCERVLLAFLPKITDIDKDTPSQLTKDDIIMTCLILCTAEYCMEPLYQIVEKLRMDEQFEDAIFVEERERCFQITTDCINLLIKNSELFFTQAFTSMVKLPWRLLDHKDVFNRISPYVQETIDHLSFVILLVREKLSTVSRYFANFYHKLATTFFTSFIDHLYLCKPIGPRGAEQLWVDVQSLKSFLLDLPTMGQSREPRVSYTELVHLEVDQVEAIVKVMMIPHQPMEKFVSKYLSITKDDRITQFENILEMKGIEAGNERDGLIEIYTRQSTT